MDIPLISYISVIMSRLVYLDNDKFLADFWLYSKQEGVRFDQNFIHLLPGKHLFTITFESLPLLEDFNYKFR